MANTEEEQLKGRKYLDLELQGFQSRLHWTYSSRMRESKSYGSQNTSGQDDSPHDILKW